MSESENLTTDVSDGKMADLQRRKSELLQEANALILEGCPRDRTADPENREARLKAARIRAELRAIVRQERHG